MSRVCDPARTPATGWPASPAGSARGRLVLSGRLEPVGLLLGGVHRARGVLRRAVDGVEDQRVRTGVEEVVLPAGGDDDEVALGHAALVARDDRFPGAADERED